MDSSNRKKRQKSPNQTQQIGGNNKQPKNQQQQQHLKQKRHQEALALSQQLRNLSSQKRLKECLSLYYDSANDDLRDVHHGSIVVDCCARCGDVGDAEKVVLGMLRSGLVTSKNSENNTNHANYFWTESTQQQCRKVPIQAWTALLKGYVHSGMLYNADSLFCHLCNSQISHISDGKKRKRETNIESGRPNVRTLNTLLRGCLWTATSSEEYMSEQNSKSGNKAKGEHKKKDQYKATTKHQQDANTLVGGVITAERAWSLCVDCDEGDSSSSKLEPDSSSYEYSISLLAQSLKCDDARKRFEVMKSHFKVDCTSESNDPSILESIAVCLVAISRGYTLLGNASRGRKCAEEALQIIEKLLTSKYLSSQNPSPQTASSEAKTVTGGKQAWKSKLKNGNADATESGGRREESNQLFRTHRLTELRSEAASLKELCASTSENDAKNQFVTSDANYVARWMMSRLFYFSGGGTTGLETADDKKYAGSSSEEDIEQTYTRWMHSLWHSFGLKETTRRLLSDNENRDKELHLIFPSKKRDKVHLPNVLSPQTCLQFRDRIMGKDNRVIDNNGFINFRNVFSTLNEDNSSSASAAASAPVHIEIGAGSGDWIALQAQLNPTENYVAVELRSDRVAQTFSKCLLHHDFNKTTAATKTLSSTASAKARGPLENVCCVGSECGSFLRQRITPGSIQTIFVNHPEPPTQTYDNASTALSANPGDEEPAHMLNSQILLAAAKCLRPDGKGRLIIVTDNLIYARLVCRTMVRILKEGSLVGISAGEVGDLRKLEAFGSGVHLYEGKPSISIGHYTPKGNFSGGTSYFDRLWRTGAGKHADMKKRFIIAVRTRNSADDNNPDTTNDSITKKGMFRRNNEHNKMSQNTRAQPKSSGDKNKKANKKRSAEKQRLRNERRLLKKQQQQQQQQQTMARKGSK